MKHQLIECFSSHPYVSPRTAWAVIRQFDTAYRITDPGASCEWSGIDLPHLTDSYPHAFRKAMMMEIRRQREQWIMGEITPKNLAQEFILDSVLYELINPETPTYFSATDGFPNHPADNKYEILRDVLFQDRDFEWLWEARASCESWRNWFIDFNGNTERSA